MYEEVIKKLEEARRCISAGFREEAVGLIDQSLDLLRKPKCETCGGSGKLDILHELKKGWYNSKLVSEVINIGQIVALMDMLRKPEEKLSDIAIPCPGECGGILIVEEFIDRPTCNECGKVYLLRPDCKQPEGEFTKDIYDNIKKEEFIGAKSPSGKNNLRQKLLEACTRLDQLEAKQKDWGKNQTFHYCVRGIVPYPQLLCSVCRTPDTGSTDFNAYEKVKEQAEQIKGLKERMVSCPFCCKGFKVNWSEERDKLENK